MKKKIALIVAMVLAAAVALSVTAHAAEIGSSGGETTIAITDITPREEQVKEQEQEPQTEKENRKDEAKDYAVSSYYPVAVQTLEDSGVRLLVKTFLVPEDTSPQGLIEEGLTRRGVAYEATDILRREVSGEVERKTISQTVTVDSETDKLENILPLLKSSLDYREDGFSGTLTLDKDSIRAEESGSSSYAYTLKEEKEFPNLDRNDLAYIPKTTEKNGVTLDLADVDWTPMASGTDNSEVPSLFKAAALYTGTAWGSKADGYTVTADYTGEVSRAAESQVAYSIVYEEVQPVGISFPWKTIRIVVLIVVSAAGVGTGIFFLVRFLKKEKPRKVQRDPYADRPKMYRPEMLREMDRGLEDDR